MARIAHISDIHFGAKPSGLGFKVPASNGRDYGGKR